MEEVYNWFRSPHVLLQTQHLSQCETFSRLGTSGRQKLFQEPVAEEATPEEAPVEEEPVAEEEVPQEEEAPPAEEEPVAEEVFPLRESDRIEKIVVSDSR